MKVLIADDELNLANYLNDRLGDLWPEAQVVGIAVNGAQALEMIEAHEPDVAFLDIRMPGLSGLDIAKRLGGTVRVVFVTAFDQHAVAAFEHNAVDYLLKPVTDERLLKTIDKLKRVSAPAPPGALDLTQLLQTLAAGGAVAPKKYLRWIRASLGETTRQIAVEEVYYFEARDKYVSVITHDGESLIRLPLTELAAELDPAEFWQIHRSTIVNVNRIDATTRNFRGQLVVKLRDMKTELPVSRAYAHLFKGM